jgi:hypothetical protein
MEIRIFQIIVPIIFLIYLFFEVKKVLNNNKSWVDLTPHFILISTLLILSIFPDWSTNKLAEFLGFKSNINAILFSFLGILSLFILRLHDKLRNMKSEISTLTIECALIRKKMDS